MAAALAAQVSFPEQTIADCTRESLRDAAKAKERSDTLSKVPVFAGALDAAAVTAGHVDAITSKAKPLTDDQRSEYFERVAGLGSEAERIVDGDGPEEPGTRCSGGGAPVVCTIGRQFGDP